jgi:hypothetical protein
LINTIVEGTEVFTWTWRVSSCARQLNASLPKDARLEEAGSGYGNDASAKRTQELVRARL